MSGLSVKRITAHHAMESPFVYYSFILPQQGMTLSQSFIVKVDYRPPSEAANPQWAEVSKIPLRAAMRDAYPSIRFKKRARFAMGWVFMAASDFTLLQFQSEWITIHGD